MLSWSMCNWWMNEVISSCRHRDVRGRFPIGTINLVTRLTSVSVSCNKNQMKIFFSSQLLLFWDPLLNITKELIFRSHLTYRNTLCSCWVIVCLCVIKMSPDVLQVCCVCVRPHVWCSRVTPEQPSSGNCCSLLCVQGAALEWGWCC